MGTPTFIHVGYSWDTTLDCKPAKDRIIDFIHGLVPGIRGELLHEELVGDLLRALSSFLVKLSRDCPRSLFIFHGPGGNGKGVLLESLFRRALENYAVSFLEALFKVEVH